MQISSFDFISPKITLKYNGRNSHISRIGGFLSLCLFIIICISTFYCFWSLFEPKFYSSLLYEENTNDNKLSQNINYSGINHFLQIYSYSNNGWFGDFDNRNIIIYAVKENNKLIRNNYSSGKLSDIEHWLYDKCDKINNININLFDEISNYVKNYTSSICIRFYFNPNEQKYYEIGNDGYVEPYLETSKFNEKQYSFKIIIEKCLNTSFINNNIGYICNSENNINKYFDIYDEIFIYFSYNQIMPFNSHNQFKKNYYSLSSKLGQFTYFINNINFLPIKIMKKNSFSNIHKDDYSFSLYNHFEYQKSYDNETGNLIGIYNLYLNRNILSYQIRFSNIIDILSHLGGLIKIFFLFFKILNYFNHRYITFENTKDLFYINTGIETNFNESKDISFDKIRHVTTRNFKLNQKNSNTNEDVSRRLMRNYSPINIKKKYRYFEGVTPKAKLSSKQNVSLYQIKVSSNKKNSIAKKNTNTFNIKNKDKRKSYLSQGYRVKSKDNKDNSIYIRNRSFYEDDKYNNENNNELPSSRGKNKNVNIENDSIVVHPSKKSNNEFNPLKIKKSKKATLKIPTNKIIHEKNDNSHLGLKNHNKMRHKSINYTNQKKFFRNSIFNKNHMTKNPSELIDSSKQNLFNNKNNVLLPINRTQYEKSKLEENNVRVQIINNTTEYVNSTKNLRTLGANNNINGNDEFSLFLKSLIKNKLKTEMPEGKESFANIIGRKINVSEFFKYIFLCCKTNENNIYLINNFRNNLLSEQHLYKSHINLYLIQKILQIEESYKFDFKELYINL
mgnify:CR=1 FL=1